MLLFREGRAKGVGRIRSVGLGGSESDTADRHHHGMAPVAGGHHDGVHA